MRIEPLTAPDEDVVAEQLGRRPRGVIGIAARCPIGHPAVVATLPRLPDGTPFPTTFYLTCPRAIAACSTLEASGLMTELTERLTAEPELAAGYADAHRSFLAARGQLAVDTVGAVPEIADVSAGGMPYRVKCLHALLGHALAAGPGINPIGDLTLALIEARWPFPCGQPVRVGAIDCGTNSFRLLIAGPGERGGLQELTRELQIVRLGQGVDASGQLHPDALARVFTAAERYADALRAYEVPTERSRVVATSAARDARNVDDFFTGMRARLGVWPEVITGSEEAQLSFVGALSALRELSGADVGRPARVLVMDIGGGSTELVLGDPDGRIERSVSLDIGSVRLTERFGLTGPLPAEARTEATAYVDGLLDRLGWSLGEVDTWIGVAGTVTTASAVIQELPSYDRARVHGSIVEPDQLAGLVDRLAGMTVAQIRGLGAMEAGRADVITAGALIADRVARHVGRPMLVSESDILDGIALGLLAP